MKYIPGITFTLIPLLFAAVSNEVVNEVKVVSFDAKNIVVKTESFALKIPSEWVKQENRVEGKSFWLRYSLDKSNEVTSCKYATGKLCL